MEFFNVNNPINSMNIRLFNSQEEIYNKNKNTETKTIQADSLGVLSNYAKAGISFKGVAQLIDNTDFNQRAKSIVDRVKKDPNFTDREKSDIESNYYASEIMPENIDFIEKLAFGVDEDGNPLFKDKSLIYDLIRNTSLQYDAFPEPSDLSDVFKRTISKYVQSSGKEFPSDFFENDYKKNVTEFIKFYNSSVVDFAETLCFAKNEDGSDLFPEKELIVNYLNLLPMYTADDVLHYLFAKDKNGNLILPDRKQLVETLMKPCYYGAYDGYDKKTIEKYMIGTDEKGNQLFPEKELLSSIFENVVRFYGSESSNETLESVKTREAIADKMCFGTREDGSPFVSDKTKIRIMLPFVNPENIELSKLLVFGKDKNGRSICKDEKELYDSLTSIHTDGMFKNIDILNKLLNGKNPDGSEYLKDKSYIPKFIPYMNDAEVDMDYINQLVRLCNIGELPVSDLNLFLGHKTITYKEYQSFLSIVGRDILKQIPDQDKICAIKLANLYSVNDVNEIDLKRKKDAIRSIVSQNVALYQHADSLKKYFPLIPTNKEEYCTLVRKLTNSIGIETKEISEEQVSQFNIRMDNLATLLAGLSDEEFNSLEFKQDYSKDDFIRNTYEIVKDLSNNERQKVFDYFGFELKKNPKGTVVDNNNISYSIIGYPVNINNGKKLSSIASTKTREVVEQLRSKVVKFTENNHVSCSNKDLEVIVNEILNVVPECRTMIDKTQHGSHNFTVFNHSLKVMQKIVQNPKYAALSDSDKKIMLLASLFHDISKSEGTRDKLHPDESSFDTFFITKKLNLTKTEQIKLYTLIKYHEWLGYTNSSRITTPEEKTKRQKSVAYDLHFDNLFELSKIFTEADLKGVKTDDAFYNKNLSVFKENAEIIDAYISKLKKTQPFMPVTKIPKASRIKEAITHVNEDGSTNLNGIYQDKNGMVIIQYNQVENETWEQIGFDKGSVSHGIKGKTAAERFGDTDSSCCACTGNIKWFAHGLDNVEDLQNFDAFKLPDSDALLSVSYMELPESKYRLFRKQGILLDVPTKYQQGGGNTDRGSGCKKSLSLFKRDYAYEGSPKYSNRTYISDLIKTELNLNDEEYIEFVNNNLDKALVDIQPKEYQEKLVKAFSSINSNKRKGDRSYNEMYITNPSVMGVYAYSDIDHVGNVMEFVSNQQDFLKKYALEEDLPFFVFGD